MTIREFLGLKVSCDYITIVNNDTLNEVLWDGEYETIDNQIPDKIANSKLVKWSIYDNGIWLWINL